MTPVSTMLTAVCSTSASLFAYEVARDSNRSCFISAGLFKVIHTNHLFINFDYPQGENSEQENQTEKEQMHSNYISCLVDLRYIAW